MNPGSEHQGGAAAGGCGGGFRASHADRGHVIDMLKAAYVQGRVSKDEFDLRVSQAFGSRTWTELDALTGDIPPLARVAPAPGRCHRPGRAIPVFVTAAMASIGLVLVALLTAPSPAERPASSPPARFIRADTGLRVPGRGTVSGTFIAMGGPVPVHGRPMMTARLPGRIIAIGSTNRRVQVTTGRRGTFRLSLPLGSYRLIGYSPHVTVGHSEMRCAAIHPVHVRVGRVLSHVKVICALP